MKGYAVAARIGVGSMLLIFWGLVDSPLFGVHFILVLIGLTAVRYKFGEYKVLPLLEGAASVVYALWWPPALLGLWLTMFSMMENRWNRREQELTAYSHAERTERLKLEAQIDQTAKDSINAARVAELTERARIAQSIHDHVGHEMHGALIALQTAKKLHGLGDSRAGEVLGQSLQRLESASATLRETVHNLKPAYTIGPDTLVEICNGFDFCQVRYSKAGDLMGVVHWELLAANLKELLTNVARHSNATAVTVRLDGNAKYVRLTVKDNGKPSTRRSGHISGQYLPAMSKSKTTQGLGLAGMKDRIRMAGGNFTVSEADGFQVVCVLPKTQT